MVVQADFDFANFDFAFFLEFQLRYYQLPQDLFQINRIQKMFQVSILFLNQGFTKVVTQLLMQMTIPILIQVQFQVSIQV